MAIVLAAVCACTAPLDKGPAQTTDPVIEPTQVAENIWYFHGASGVAAAANEGYTSNAGFVVTHDGVIVFDALGTPALGRAMLRAIASITPLPVKRVIVSHYHADHMYGLQPLKAAGAEIWARAEGQAYLASDIAAERLQQRRSELAPWVDDKTRLLPADRWLSFPESGTIPFDFGGVHFELIDGGDSHSPGDLMLLIRDAGVLFAGDLFFTGRLPYVVDGNTRDWLGALERMARSSPSVVVPGHGSVSYDVATDLDLTRRYLRYLRKTMGAAATELESFDTAYARTDWSAFEMLPTFDQANRRNAYSVFLEMQAESLN
ncbi:MAG: MBL fold metallo-hydrolase [Nevskiales bacterium]|nr:MBL fold metallo-hydrolase [Nevskiales bacterium]